MSGRRSKRERRAEPTGAFGKAARHYAERDYRAIPLEGKDAWVSELHGHANGTDPHPDVWWQSLAWWSYNVGLVVPRGCLVMDVDIHDDKHGDRAILAALSERWLPAAPQFSARRGRSRRHGHYWYRDPLPPGSWPRDLGSGSAVEIVRPGEYVVAPPSVHPDTGESYGLFGGPGGHQVDWRAMARPAELPLFPESDAVALIKYAEAHGRRPRAARADFSGIGSGKGWEFALGWLDSADPNEVTCPEMASSYASALGKLEKSREGGRHQDALEQQFRVIKMAERGHTGLGQALAGLYLEWQAMTPRDGMSDEDWAVEFLEMLDRPLASFIESGKSNRRCGCPDPAVFNRAFKGERRVR